jgi:DNA-directed RNA polymerase subunit RPC12/RpoP
MAKCPSCSHEVATPFFGDLQGWSQLTCPQCKARLELKPRPIAILFFPILLIMIRLGRLGHRFAIVAIVLLVSAAIAMVLLLVVRPQLRLRKPLPKPAIRLDIDGPPK